MSLTGSKLSYNNVSLGLPRLARDPKTEEQVFMEELRLANKTSKRVPSSIYRSGQAPAWAEDEEDETEEVDLLSRKKKLVSQVDRQTKTAPIGLASDGSSSRAKAKRQIYTAQVIKEEVEEQQVKKEEVEEEEGQQDEELYAKPFKDKRTEAKLESEMKVMKIDVSKLEVQGEESSEEESAEDEEDVRRARRERFLRKAEDEKAEEKKELEESKNEEEAKESSSEYETDTSESEDDFASSRPLLKPVFVSKQDRETVAERKRLEADEEEAAEALRKRKKERKKESKRMVQEDIKREEEMKRNGIAEIEAEENLPDDDDDGDEEEELEKWKVRELTRIKSQKMADEKHDAEQAAILRRRNMTDEQIIRENERNPIQRKEKGQMRYLQKYYHPGGYFQDDDEGGIRLQDFAQATGADRVIDRTLLPEVMQVKKFGLKGRTKWTHLTDQDTSGYQYVKPGQEKPEGKATINNAWINAARDPKAAPIVAKHKMGGMGGEFSRPSKKPKAKK